MIEINHLSVTYQQTSALKDISVTIPPNVRMAIIGPNGAGKSTFIKAVLGLVKSTHGGLTIFDSSLKEVRQRIAYVQQTSEVNWNFPTTVFDVVLMGVTAKRFGFQPISPEARATVEQALATMELTRLKNRPINQLSGGQKQRVFLARAIAQNADLYLLDEPLAGVDMKSEALIMNQFQEFQRLGKTSITVHHDLNTVGSYFDTVMLMNRELIAIGPLEEAFTQANIDRAYHGDSALPSLDLNRQGSEIYADSY